MNDRPAKDNEKLIDAGPYKQLALNVGANFAQSIASETFKQTIVANAAGVAAIVAYLTNAKSIVHPVPFAIAAACFLSGVGASLLALMLTYTHSSRLLAKMLNTAVRGTSYQTNWVDKATGLAGSLFGWIGVILFLVGAGASGFGLYTQFAEEFWKSGKLALS